MKEAEVVKRLAVERCRVYVSHLSALLHLRDNSDEAYNQVIEHLSKDLNLLEESMHE